MLFLVDLEQMEAVQVGGAIEGSIAEISADDVASELREAKEVMIVPGYGMAVAQAQHVLGYY